MGIRSLVPRGKIREREYKFHIEALANKALRRPSSKHIHLVDAFGLSNRETNLFKEVARRNSEKNDLNSSVYLFTNPDPIEIERELRDVLKNELNSGVRVLSVSADFNYRSDQPDQSDQPTSLWHVAARTIRELNGHEGRKANDTYTWLPVTPRQLHPDRHDEDLRKGRKNEEFNLAQGNSLAPIGPRAVATAALPLPLARPVGVFARVAERGALVVQRAVTRGGRRAR